MYPPEVTEFIDTVDQMMEMQKKYFKTREKWVLSLSLELERKVRTMIENLKNEQNLFRGK